MTIALATAVGISSCGNKQEKAGPVGTPIGDGVFLIEKTAEDGTKTCQIADSTGYSIGDEYQSVEAEANYLIGTKANGEKDLMNLKGRAFAHCTEFTVMPYYATSEAAPEGKFIKTNVGNGNHLAFDLKTYDKLIGVEGLKEDVLALDNGFAIYKLKGLWGIAKGEAEEPIHANDAKEITVITDKNGKLYFWINTAGGAGLINEKGDAVKSMSAAQIKAVKKNAKKLWEEGPISAIVVKTI